MKAFRAGTGDFDGQAFGQELADFARFADRNWSRMTPDAKAAFLTYQSHAFGAQLQGQTGAGVFDYAASRSSCRTWWLA